MLKTIQAAPSGTACIVLGKNLFMSHNLHCNL